MTNQNITIALDKLDLDPLNVRKTHDDKNIAELAASIFANGLLQNLIVRTGIRKGRFYVSGGGRRLKALLLLAAEKKIAKTCPVNCQLRDEAEATELSLTENMFKMSMNPADAYEAYAKLEAEGKSIADIAVRFGTTEVMIRKRLSLGKVSPILRNLFRTEEMSYEQLTAFTICDDHGEQERVWNELPSYNRSAFAIRRALSMKQFRTLTSVSSS